MVRGIYIVCLTLSHETTIIALHLPILQALPKAHTEAATRATAMARRWKSLPLKTGPIPVIFQVGSNLRAQNVRLVRSWPRKFSKKMINNYRIRTKIDQLLDLVEMGKTLFGLIMAHNIQVRKVYT